MRSRMIAYLSGICLTVSSPVLIPWQALPLLSLLILFCCIYPRLRYRSMTLLFFLGVFVASVWGHWQLQHRLQDTGKKTDWYLKGVVTGLPSESADRFRFQLEISEAIPLQANINAQNIRRTRLTLYNSRTRFLPGDQVSLHARLTPPRGYLNPDGFDYERWLLSRGIDATGYVRKILAHNSGIAPNLDKTRLQISEQIQRRYPEQAHMALLQAITIGERGLLNDQQWRQLKETGTTHLAVISGLHIGLIALAGFIFCRCLSFVIPAVGLWPLSLLLPLGMAFFYASLAGWQVPVQRAFLMLAALMVAQLLLWQITVWDRWLIALCIVLSLSPLAVYETGFWLSFAAVALLIWLVNSEIRVWSLLRLQILLLIGMLPLYAVFFSAFSVSAPIFNLLLIPFLTICLPIVLTDLLFDQLGFGFLQPIVSWGLDLFWWVVKFGDQLSWSFWAIEGVNGISLSLALIGVVLVLLPLPVGRLLPAGILLMPLLFTETNLLHTKEGYTAWVYDIGQGLAVSVRYGDRWLIYDTGPKYRDSPSLFSRVVVPHLERYGVTHIDTVVLSHDDIDHVGGADELRSLYSIGRLYSSYTAGESSLRCKAGLSWQDSGVSFKFLAGTHGSNDNERSCVLLIEFAKCSLLLPGDIGVKTEALLQKPARPLTWLVAAHHGSNSSSSEQFLQRWRPENTLYSAGYANRFGHPHPDVKQRVREVSSRQFNTAEQGAIILKASSQDGCKLSTIRSGNKFFWR